MSWLVFHQCALSYVSWNDLIESKSSYIEVEEGLQWASFVNRKHCKQSTGLERIECPNFANYYIFWNLDRLFFPDLTKSRIESNTNTTVIMVLHWKKGWRRLQRQQIADVDKNYINSRKICCLVENFESDGEKKND